MREREYAGDLNDIPELTQTDVEEITDQIKEKKVKKRKFAEAFQHAVEQSRRRAPMSALLNKASCPASQNLSSHLQSFFARGPLAPLAGYNCRSSATARRSGMANSDASSRSRDAPRPPSLPAVSRRRRGATQTQTEGDASPAPAAPQPMTYPSPRATTHTVAHSWSGRSSPCANRGYWMDLGQMTVRLHPAVLRAANPLVPHWSTRDRPHAWTARPSVSGVRATAERERSGSGAGAERERSALARG